MWRAYYTSAVLMDASKDIQPRRGTSSSVRGPTIIIIVIVINVVIVVMITIIIITTIIRRPLWGERRCEVAPSTFARRSQG